MFDCHYRAPDAKRPRKAPSKGPPSDRTQRPSASAVTAPLALRFADLGGMDPVLQLVRELVQYPLQHPEVYRWLGVEPPRGVLLHGPPGCGKTALANAIANECGVPFLKISAPEVRRVGLFVRMFGCIYCSFTTLETIKSNFCPPFSPFLFVSFLPYASYVSHPSHLSLSSRMPHTFLYSLSFRLLHRCACPTPSPLSLCTPRPQVVSGMSGESEATLRALFQEARSVAPAIIFIGTQHAAACTVCAKNIHAPVHVYVLICV